MKQALKLHVPALHKVFISYFYLMAGEGGINIRSCGTGLNAFQFLRITMFYFNIFSIMRLHVMQPD